MKKRSGLFFVQDLYISGGIPSLKSKLRRIRNATTPDTYIKRLRK